MGDRRICPMCDKPIWEDATEAERMASPPHTCSPLRCTAWSVVGRATAPNPVTGARSMLRLTSEEE